MTKMNPNKYKIKVGVYPTQLRIDFTFPDLTRSFEYTNPQHWDGSLEDMYGLILSSYCGFPVGIHDNKLDYHLKSGIPEEFTHKEYSINLEEDEWCSINNEYDEIIYARFINYNEYVLFQDILIKLIQDFFESEGFEIRG